MNSVNQPAEQPASNGDRKASGLPTMDDAFTDITWSLTHDIFQHNHSETFDITSDENPTAEVSAYHDALYACLLVTFGLTFNSAKQTPLTRASSHLLDAFEISFRAVHELPAGPDHGFEQDLATT